MACLVQKGAKNSSLSLGGARPMRSPSGFATAGDGFAGLFVGRAAALGFALVPELFAFGEGEFDLDSSVLEVHASGDKGESALLGFAHQLAQLFFMDQELAGAQRCVIENVAVLVRTDVTVEQPELAVLD